MRLGTRMIAASCGSILVVGVLGAMGASSSAAVEPPPVAPDATVEGVARAFGISAEEAKGQLVRQDEAHRVLDRLPAGLRERLAGNWFDAAAGKLTVAVTSEDAANQAIRAGADAMVVARGRAELDRLLTSVREAAGTGVSGVYSWGVDVRNNEVRVTVDKSAKTAATERYVIALRALGDGVRVVETVSAPRQQSGTVQTGNARAASTGVKATWVSWR